MRLMIATCDGKSRTKGTAGYLALCGMCGKRFMTVEGDRIFVLEKGEDIAKSAVCRDCATRVLVEHEKDLGFSVREGLVETSAFWFSGESAAGDVTIIEK